MGAIRNSFQTKVLNSKLLERCLDHFCYKKLEMHLYRYQLFPKVANWIQKYIAGWFISSGASNWYSTHCAIFYQLYLQVSRKKSSKFDDIKMKVDQRKIELEWPNRNQRMPSKWLETMTSDSDCDEVDVRTWIFGQSVQKPCSIDKAFAMVDYNEKVPSWLQWLGR